MHNNKNICFDCFIDFFPVTYVHTKLKLNVFRVKNNVLRRYTYFCNQNLILKSVEPPKRVLNYFKMLRQKSTKISERIWYKNKNEVNAFTES